MPQHIYLEKGELFYVEGEIPKKPRGLNYLARMSQEYYIHSNIVGQGYDAAIASLKAKGVKVGNPDEAFKIALPGGDGKFKSEYFLSDFFYKIECEVEYKCNADCDIMVGVCCHLDCCIKLAILTPKRETALAERPERSQHSIWFQIAVAFTSRPTLEVIEECKSKYTITRKQ